MSQVLQVCRDSQVHLVQFLVCWLKPSSNSGINSTLGYECLHSGIRGMNNPSYLVHLTLPKSQQELVLTVNIWTADLSSGLLPGKPRSASTLGDRHYLHANLQLHPPWPRATLLPNFPVIWLNFKLYLPLYTSVYILQLHFIFINMKPTASQVRNHYSQKNQEVQLERALAHALKKTPNLHWWSNVWTSSLQVECWR